MIDLHSGNGHSLNNQAGSADYSTKDMVSRIVSLLLLALDHPPCSAAEYEEMLWYFIGCKAVMAVKRARVSSCVREYLGAT